METLNSHGLREPELGFEPRSSSLGSPCSSQGPAWALKPHDGAQVGREGQLAWNHPVSRPQGPPSKHSLPCGLQGHDPASGGSGTEAQRPLHTARAALQLWDEEMRLPGGQSWAGPRCGDDVRWPRTIVQGSCWSPATPPSEQQAEWVGRWQPRPSCRPGPRLTLQPPSPPRLTMLFQRFKASVVASWSGHSS